MKRKLSEELKRGILDAIAFERGEKVLTVREIELPDPPEPMSAKQIVQLRAKKLRLSQTAFAHLLNASPQTVHAWEQGRSKPTGPTLKFLRLIEQRPELILSAA